MSKLLLYSKTFRNNLIKWLFIYIGVMLSVTSVITYSKYISSMQSSAVARQARFNINITKGDVCSADFPSVCNQVFRTYENVDYYYSVDTSNTDVSTVALTSITIKEDLQTKFSIDSLYIKNSLDDNFTQVNNDNTTYTIQPKKINIVENFSYTNTYVRTYKVRLKYIGTDFINATDFEDILSVEYSATQRT